MLDYGLFTRKSWNDAPQWVRDEWKREICIKDADVCSTVCKPWMSCCQMVEKYGIKSGISWGSAPQSIQDKWEIKECDVHDDDGECYTCGNSPKR